MGRKVIIACAVTGSSDTTRKNPAVPVTPKQIAESAVDAAKAGAAVVHLHVRDLKTTGMSMDPALYRETVERIRSSGVDVIINLTTGAGGRYIPSEDDPARPGPGTLLRHPQERIRHVIELKPEICSLDLGSMNMGEYVIINTAGQIRTMARAIRDAGVTPEIEVFDTGHLLLARKMIEDGDIRAPGLFQLCLGVPWGQPATTDAMKFMRDLLPAGSAWFAFGISRWQMPMVAQAVLLGGNVRVGLEDNIYLANGVLAPSNAALVEKAVQIIELLGEGVATPAEAREQLGLHGGK